MQKSTKKNLTFLVIVFVSLLIVIISLLLHANEIIDIYKLNNSDIYNAYKGTVECSVFLLVISSILLIVTMIITSFSNKTKLEYVRDYKDVVDPILAESLIDKRIGAKELIMTCVARLINKGNIEYIDNNKIKLLNYDNISNYERKIVDMIFNNIGEEISFKDIRNVFLSDENKTKKFYEKFINIKKDIVEELYNKKIYDKKLDKFIKVLRIISVIIYFNIFFLLYSCYMFAHYEFDISFTYMIMLNCILALILFNKESIQKDLVQRIYEKIRSKIGLIAITFIFLFVIIIFNIYYENFALISIILVTTFFVNTILCIRTETHVLTKYGKEEYKKAYGLKKYIDDYSLMKERELDSSILWDEYLTYAIAFGISNKITNKFSEDLMKANIVLQNLNKPLRF